MSDWTFLNRHRLRQGSLASDKTYGFNGAFAFAVPGEARLVCVIASDGLCWQHVSVSFGWDKDLREFEKTISVLVENLKTKRVDCKLDVDSAEGVVVQTIPEYEALVSAVQQTLCSQRVRDTGEWWIAEPEFDRTDPPPRIIPVNKHSRLPNFDRRRDIRRLVRRPV